MPGLKTQKVGNHWCRRLCDGDKMVVCWGMSEPCYFSTVADLIRFYSNPEVRKWMNKLSNYVGAITKWNAKGSTSKRQTYNAKSVLNQSTQLYLVFIINNVHTDWEHLPRLPSPACKLAIKILLDPVWVYLSPKICINNNYYLFILSFAPRSIAKMGMWPGYSPFF